MTVRMTDLANEKQISHDWAAVLQPMEQQLNHLSDFLGAERRNGMEILPECDRILSAFVQPLESVRVIIVGQDPYPTPDHPTGLAFAVNRNVRPLPRSLKNMYRELQDDLGISPPEHGDLTGWSKSGVMLLNRVLTVRSGQPASHHNKGWEKFTEHAIKMLVQRGGPLVAILWGNQARNLRDVFADVPIIESAHPSPLSASRGFFGSRPFSRANQALIDQGAEPIDWHLSARSSAF